MRSRPVLAFVSACVVLVGAPASGGVAKEGGVGCPAQAGEPVKSNHPGTASQLVPGHPRAVVLCRYSGLNDDPPTSLAGSARIRKPARARRLARRLEKLPEFPEGTVACPMDDAS